MPDLADPIEAARARILARRATMDPAAQPHVQNEDGSVSTVRSIGIEEDGQHINIPTVSEDGRIMENDEAVATYRKTGRHLGKFGSREEADHAAQALHESEARRIADPIEQARQRILNKPMDLDTKKAVLRRVYGGRSPGEVDLDYQDTGKPLTEREAMAQAEATGYATDKRTPYQRAIDTTLEKAVPGARTMGHAKRIMEAIPEVEAPTFGEKATAVAGEFNRAFQAPTVGVMKMVNKVFGGRAFSPEGMHAAESFATGDDNPRIARAREALSESAGGRFALGAGGLAGALPGMTQLGRSTGSPTGGMAIQAFEASGGDPAAAGEAALFGGLGTGASKIFDAWLAKLPVAARSKAVATALSAGSGGASFIITDALIHGIDPEQALQNGLFGVGMSLAHGGGKALNARALGRQAAREMPSGRMALPEGTLPPPEAPRGPLVPADTTVPENRRLAASTPDRPIQPIEGYDSTVPSERRMGVGERERTPDGRIIPGESRERLPALPESTRGVPLTPYPPLTPEHLAEYRRTGKLPYDEYAGAEGSDNRGEAYAAGVDAYERVKAAGGTQDEAMAALDLANRKVESGGTAEPRRWFPVEPPERGAERPPGVPFKYSREAPYGIDRPAEPSRSSRPPSPEFRYSREAPYGVERPQEPYQANPPPVVRPGYSVERPLGNASLDDVRASDSRRKASGYAEPTKPDGKPLTRVTASFSDTGEATPESQRGAVSLGKPDLSKLRGLAGKTTDFVMNDTIRPVAKIAPETHAVMGEGANFKESAIADAELAFRRLAKGVDKATLSRAEMLAAEGELRSRAATLRGNKPFDRAFPTEADVQAGARDPKILDVVNRHKAEFVAIEKENVGAGVNPQPSRNRLFPGLRLNMVPRTAEEAGIRGLLGRKSNVRLTGPSIQPSQFSKEFTGRAKYGYDLSFKRQFREALTEARDTRRKLDAIEAGNREGVVVPFSEKAAKNPAYEGWSLYSAGIRGELTPLKPGQLGPNTNGVYLVHPDLASPLKTWLGHDQMGIERGLGKAASQLLTRLSTSGIAEATGHGVGNLLPGAIRAGKNYGAGVPVKMATYFADKANFYRDMKRLTKYGAAKGEYERTGLGLLASPGSIPLDYLDVAARTAVLDHVESEIAAGRAPDTFDTRRKALLQLGNYNALTTDALTRAVKAIPFGNVFATAGKTGTVNAGRMIGMSSGIGATSAKARLLQAAKIAAPIWGGYLASAAAHNLNETGDAFPDDMPWWAWAGPMENGTRTYSVGAAKVLGIDGALRFTGLGSTIEGIIHGFGFKETAKRALSDVAKKQVSTYTGGPLARVVEGLAAKKDIGKIAVDAVPLLEAVARFKDKEWQDLFESQIGAFSSRKGEARGSFDKIRSGEKEHDRERRDAKAKARGAK